MQYDKEWRAGALGKVLIALVLLVSCGDGVNNYHFNKKAEFYRSVFKTHSLKARFHTCDHRLQAMVACVDKEIPVRVFSCHRTHDEQQRLCRRGLSGACRDNSYHRHNPSLAVDMVPIHEDGSIDWNDWDSLVEMGVEAIICWKDLGLPGKLTWGMVWRTRTDPFHFQVEGR